jgi:AcrR family transcriptional regulator
VTSPDRQRTVAASPVRRPAAVRPGAALRPRPGGRATRVVSSVVEATLQELARLGYQALRVEDVAARASVNKTTIYRRWPTKGDLVLAALREGSRDLDFMPDTGSIRGDMLALLESAFVSKDSTAFRAFISLVLSDAVSPEIARLVRVLRLEYRERWVSLVRRGIARGELPATTPAHLLAELVGAVPTVRKLRNDEPLDRDTREAIVDLLLAGARASVDPPSPASPEKGATSPTGAPRRRNAATGATEGTSRDPRRRAI